MDGTSAGAVFHFLPMSISTIAPGPAERLPRIDRPALSADQVGDE
jgi:hypothetical protein